MSWLLSALGCTQKRRHTFDSLLLFMTFSTPCLRLWIPLVSFGRALRAIPTAAVVWMVTGTFWSACRLVILAFLGLSHDLSSLFNKISNRLNESLVTESVAMAIYGGMIEFVWLRRGV